MNFSLLFQRRVRSASYPASGFRGLSSPYLFTVGGERTWRAVIRAVNEAPAHGGRLVEQPNCKDRRVPTGRTESSPRFQPWVAIGKEPRPRRGERKTRTGPAVLSSLTGLVSHSRHNPAMNRWAIFERPYGTWTHDTVNK